MTKLTLAIGVVVFGATAAACGGTDQASGTGVASPQEDTEVPTVLATTSIWADVVGNVACDGLAEVRTIVPPGGDPHSFEVSLKDREAMAGAALVVANGLGLEESLEDTLDAIESDGVEVVRVGEQVETLAAGDSHDDEAGHDDEADQEEEGHGSEDPHIWFDPTRVAATLPAIAEGLAAAGLDRASLDTCVADYTDRLERLDAEIGAIVEPLPVERRLLITNHDSLSYFADRYDFEVLGSVIPSPSSLAATNPADLETLAGVIARTGVPAIFAETQHSSSDTVALAARVGDVEVVPLQTDTLGAPDSGTDTYVDWLSVTAGEIVGALR
jgi:zinc/manganese transport system substrate-binding protein